LSSVRPKIHCAAKSNVGNTSNDATELYKPIARKPIRRVRPRAKKPRAKNGDKHRGTEIETETNVARKRLSVIRKDVGLSFAQMEQQQLSQRLSKQAKARAVREQQAQRRLAADEITIAEEQARQQVAKRVSISGEGGVGVSFAQSDQLQHLSQQKMLKVQAKSQKVWRTTRQDTAHGAVPVGLSSEQMIHEYQRRASIQRREAGQGWGAPFAELPRMRRCSLIAVQPQG
jgi:hypothetical protein